MSEQDRDKYPEPDSVDEAAPDNAEDDNTDVVVPEEFLQPKPGNGNDL